MKSLVLLFPAFVCTKRQENFGVMTNPSISEAFKGERERTSNDARGGIMNIGNTCYMASVLQVLFHDTAFVQGIRESVEKAANDSDRSLSARFVSMSDELGNGKNVDPRKFKNELAKHNSQFSTGEQQDAQEMLLCLLNALQDELNGASEICHVRESFEIVQRNTFECTNAV